MYEKPQLERFGTLRELTRIGFSSIPGDGIFLWSHTSQSLSQDGGEGGGLEGGGEGPYLS